MWNWTRMHETIRNHYILNPWYLIFLVAFTDLWYQSRRTTVLCQRRQALLQKAHPIKPSTWWRKSSILPSVLTRLQPTLPGPGVQLKCDMPEKKNWNKKTVIIKIFICAKILLKTIEIYRTYNKVQEWLLITFKINICVGQNCFV